MNVYNEFKKKIQYRAEILRETIEELQRSGLPGDSAAAWRSHLDGAYGFLKDPLLKIAVVGSVKSGKSTLINAMVGEDLLKRGAGIVTAFITRVVTGEEQGGWVELKSWPQINSEVNAGLRMLPVFEEAGGEDKDLDLREQGDRGRIAFWTGKMKSEWLQDRGTLDPHFMFLDRVLQGYDLVEGEIGDEPKRTVFGSRDILRHQLYAGEERRSVYVRDIEIHCPAPWLGEHVELADCQGSDSPNPAHFELLQHYLLSSHFIVYVIGSRTGLREADFKLLDLIKSLKMFPQTLFVLNMDFDIHAGPEEIQEIADRVRSELGWVVRSPALFGFSALFHLLKGLGDRSPKFERRRFKLWKETKALSKTTESGWGLFKKELENRIGAKRTQVLLGCCLSRLEMIASNVNDSARIRQSALGTNAAGVEARAEKLRDRHAALQSTLHNLSDAVSGLNARVKTELEARVESCFNPERGTIVREALDLVELYPIETHGRERISDHARLIREYYAFYLDFRRNISRHLIEKVNLRIVEFAKNEELQLNERIGKSSEALWSFFGAALADYRREVTDAAPHGNPYAQAPNLTESHHAGKFAPPSFSAFLQRNNLTRGILFLKFGLTSLPAILSSIRAQMRRSTASAPEGPEIENLFRKAREMARNEARSELLRAFAEFRDNLLSGFLHRLADEGCIHLLEEFRSRAAMAQVDFAGLIQESVMEGRQRRDALETLTRSRQITSAMLDELEGLRREAEGLTG